jgi:cytidylate kinase
MNANIPVLTIDGPSGAGKGTASRAVANRLGWHFLDSGAIYRSLGVAVTNKGVALDDIDAIVGIADAMDLRFEPAEPPRVFLDGQDITDQIPTETSGTTASRIAAYGPVRRALLQKQREFRRPPGLVADGRDMGTVVFPDAPYKIFLTASVEVRAHRRYKQLKEKGIDVRLASLMKEIEERDRRDRERAEAPLVMAEGAVLIDSSELTVEQVIARCLDAVGIV